jgi:acyl dehydratase
MSKTMKVGDSASVTKVFTEEEVRQFATISGDTNPIHLDKEFAAASVFGQRVVHGMLTDGAIYLGQSLSFKAPVLLGEAVTASVEIIKIREDKPIVTLRAVCVNSKGQVVIEGESIVKVA